MRDHILKLKNDIKELSNEQRELKLQRKTVNFTGVRTTSAASAQYTHQMNRIKLRYMYLVYGLLRGRTPDQIEPNRKTEIDPRILDYWMKKYSPEIAEAA